MLSLYNVRKEEENHEIKTKTYRTVSNYFFTEIENLLEKSDIKGRKFGWLYKENETKNEVEMN